jgi:hypothetical protein
MTDVAEKKKDLVGVPESVQRKLQMQVAQLVNVTVATGEFEIFLNLLKHTLGAKIKAESSSYRDVPFIEMEARYLAGLYNCFAQERYTLQSHPVIMEHIPGRVLDIFEDADHRRAEFDVAVQGMVRFIYASTGKLALKRYYVKVLHRLDRLDVFSGLRWYFEIGPHTLTYRVIGTHMKIGLMNFRGSFSEQQCDDPELGVTWPIPENVYSL